jgi:D-sedoheptulose 7-phosphate isomerase
MDVDAFVAAELDQHQAVLNAVRERLGAPFARLLAVCAGAIRADAKIVLFGNGGSAADAQHLAAEFAVRYKEDRAPIRGLALTTDTSALTAAANDFGYEEVFARQVRALCRPGDVAIGLSTSGGSENVLRGLRAARAIGAVAAGFSGRDGGAMKEVADPCLIVPSDDTARIQEMHILLGHMLCGALERELGLL